MHDDLQPRAHLPHLVQAVSSNFILKSDIFEIRPRNVPTGHIILQYNRPFVKDRVPTRIKKAAGIEYTINWKSFNRNITKSIYIKFTQYPGKKIIQQELQPALQNRS